MCQVYFIETVVPINLKTFSELFPFFFFFQFLSVIFEVRTQVFFGYALFHVGDRDNRPFPILIAYCFCNKG